MACTQWQHCCPFFFPVAGQLVIFIKLKHVWLQGDQLVRVWSWKGHMFDPPAAVSLSKTLNSYMITV